jgi:N-acetylglucosaminyl-diphospho-decaprenol L-rhamnosyltransferase
VTTLIATYASGAGGSERLLLDVARGLSQPPLVACPAGWLADRARAAGLTVLELPPRSQQLRGSARRRAAAALRLGAHARELERLCTDLRPDLFVAWGMRTGIAAAAGVLRLHDRPPVVLHHGDLLPGPAIARAVRSAAARSDLVVCVSHAVARDLDPGGRLGERVGVVHAGVDTERFRPARDPAGSDVLLLGALVPWKRPDLALEAVARAAGRVPELRLRVAGGTLYADSGELLERLRRRAAQPDLAGRVEFSGPLADPAAALRDAGCLLHCAEREPFGLVLVEALASGTPVVAPDAAGPAEIVDSTCGALYRPGDAGAAADALVDVLSRRAELTGAARKRAEAAFALRDMQARWDELLRAAAASPAAPATAHAPGAGMSVVTVTHDSARELKRLSASLRRHLPGAQLVVVDNASSDDGVEVARAAGANVIRNGENVGFGAAANAGVAAATEPVVALVNPDVELVDDSLARLAAEALPGRLLAPLVLNGDGTPQDSAHPRPASAATALYALLPGALLPGPARRAAEPWRSRRPRRVGWATGACLVAEAATLRGLGPFDASIFMYAEDLDLGLRAETWFRPDARVVHHGAHATSKAFGGEAYDLLARQRREVVRRRLGSGRARVDDVIELVTFADRALLRRLLGRSAETEVARFRARRRARRSP